MERFDAVLGSGDKYNIGMKTSSYGDGKLLSLENTDKDVLFHGGFKYASALVYLEIIHPTPCNNWRVSVSCAGDKTSSPLILNKTNGYKIEYINGDKLNPKKNDTPSASTQTLTVWRKLYLERDLMKTKVDFQEPDNVAWHSIQGGDLLKRYGGRFFKTSLDAIYQKQYDSPMKARFFEKDEYNRFTKVAEINYNFHTHGNDFSIILTNQAPLSANYITLADDDVKKYSLDKKGKFIKTKPEITPYTPKKGLFNKKDMYPAACITVDFATLARYNNRFEKFRLHMNEKDTIPKAIDYNDVLATVGAIKGSWKGGKLFWTTEICNMYQGNIEGSLDGTIAYYLGGISVPFWEESATNSAVGGCLVFIEPGRDFSGTKYSLNNITSCHEVGHLLGGAHYDGGIMAAGGRNAGFSGDSLLKFMLLKESGPSNK